MQTVVITGSAGGLGGGLALAFYQRGFNVVVSDLNAIALEARLALIEPCVDRPRLLAVVCNVTDPQQMQQLWDSSIEKFGRIDYWLNNAGVGGTQASIIDSDLDKLLPVIDVNVKGVIIGTKIALMGMKIQGGGRIYNVAGFGVNGMVRRNMVIYGTSKCAVGYFSKGVAKEQQGSNVSVGWINPGMVVTPLVINSARKMGLDEWNKGGRKVFNLFAETPEYAGELVVQAVLADHKNGTFIKILTVSKAIRCLLRSLFRKRDLFAAHGL